MPIRACLYRDGRSAKRTPLPIFCRPAGLGERGGPVAAPTALYTAFCAIASGKAAGWTCGQFWACKTTDKKKLVGHLLLPLTQRPKQMTNQPSASVLIAQHQRRLRCFAVVYPGFPGANCEERGPENPHGCCTARGDCLDRFRDGEKREQSKKARQRDTPSVRVSQKPCLFCKRLI